MDGFEAVISNPPALCIPHSSGFGGGAGVVGTTDLCDVDGGAAGGAAGGLHCAKTSSITSWVGDGLGAADGMVLLQHTSISFLQVVILLSIWIVTGLEAKISSFSDSRVGASKNPPCLISILFVTLTTSFPGGTFISPSQS